jgi:hypothetical protein
MGYLVFLNVISFLVSIFLYIVDIKYMDGILNNVEKDDQLINIIESPDLNLSKKDIIK